MKHQITFKNFDQDRRINERLNRFIAKLEKQLAAFSPDQLLLQGTVEKHSTRSLYRVTLRLNLTGRSLMAQEERADGESALKEAFLELERQVKKYRAFTRREHLWKRPARRAEIRTKEKFEGATEADQQRELFWSLIEPYLDRFYRYTRREIVYLVSTGDLVSQDLIVEDVVSAVLVRAYQQFRQRPPKLEPYRWLIKLTREYLREEVKRFRSSRRDLHVEQDIPEVPPPEEVTTLGEEILDFYQPDEDLKMEDVLPDHRFPSPEEVAETLELQRFIGRNLSRLPLSWRDAFVLHFIEGFTAKEVALIMGQSEQQVKKEVNSAREFLRHKLVESGYAIPA